MYIAIQLDQVNGIIVSACTSPSLLYMYTVHVELKFEGIMSLYKLQYYTFYILHLQYMYNVCY